MTYVAVISIILECFLLSALESKNSRAKSKSIRIAYYMFIFSITLFSFLVCSICITEMITHFNSDELGTAIKLLVSAVITGVSWYFFNWEKDI